MYRTIIVGKFTYGTDVICREDNTYNISTTDNENSYNIPTQYEEETNIPGIPESYSDDYNVYNSNIGIIVVVSKSPTNKTIIYDMLVEDNSSDYSSIDEDNLNNIIEVDKNSLNYHKIYLRKDDDNIYRTKNIVLIHNSEDYFGITQYDTILDNDYGYNTFDKIFESDLTFFIKNKYQLKSNKSLKNITISAKVDDVSKEVKNIDDYNKIIILNEFYSDKMLTLKLTGTDSTPDEIILEVW